MQRNGACKIKVKIAEKEKASCKSVMQEAL